VDEEVGAAGEVGAAAAGPVARAAGAAAGPVVGVAAGRVAEHVPVAVGDGPAAIVRRPLAEEAAATGDRAAVVGQEVVIDRQWLNGREPGAGAAADPEAPCKRAAGRGQARLPATGDQVLDQEPGVGPPSVGPGLVADRESAAGPVA
jgi:hypothetical protein